MAKAASKAKKKSYAIKNWRDYNESLVRHPAAEERQDQAARQLRRRAAGTR